MSQRVSIIVSVALGKGDTRSDRSASARVHRTLSALAQQAGDAPFEVIVCSPPAEVVDRRELGEFATLVHAERVGEEGRSALANAGARWASGDIIAFLDAGAVPDPYWLGELVPAFDRPEVGGVGGVVFDADGRLIVHDFVVCDRLGHRRNDRPAQPGVFDRPLADPFTVLHGSNCAFRRSALARAEGFDALFESDLAIAELCLRLIDLGIVVRPLRGAPVYCETVPDCKPEPAQPPDDPFCWVRDLCCFALRYGRPQRSTSEVLGHLTEEAERLRGRARGEYRARRWPSSHVDFFARQLDRALGTGVELGLSKPRQGRGIPWNPENECDFREFPVRRPEGPRRTYCFLAPSESDGIVSRAAIRVLARETARRGHIAHLYLAESPRGNPPTASGESIAWSDGVWVHPAPARSSTRWDHVSISASHRERLDHAESAYESVRRLRIGRRIDAVIAPAGSSAGLFCRQDSSMPCALFGSNPPTEELALEAWDDGRDVLGAVAPVRSEDCEPFFDRAEEWLRERADSQADLRFSGWPPGSRLRVSMVGAFIEPRDATSNVFREQMEAIARFAEANELRLDFRAFVLRSRLDDPRVWVVPDVAALTMDSHFLASDLIIYHFGYYNPLFESMPLSPRSARRVVTFHGITPPELFPLERRGEVIDSYRQAANLLGADQVIVQSGSLATQLEGMGVAAERISRVPLSVPWSSWDPTSDSRHPTPDPVGPPTPGLRIAFVGRFVPSKAIHELLEAVALWRAGGAPHIRLDLVGNRLFSDAGYLDSLFHTVKRRGLQDVVNFHFDIEHSALIDVLRRADVFVMPSYHEGFCVPVIEAFVCGCAVISTDAGALPETCGGFAAMYPAGDVAALLDRLRAFADAHSRGLITTINGEIPRDTWNEALRGHLAGFTREAYWKRFCSALFGEGIPDWDRTGASSDVIAATHRQALLKLREGSEPSKGGARPAMPTRLLQALTGNDAVPPNPPPCEGLPKTPLDLAVERLHAARCWLHRVPVVGNACRYVKRLISLPWNFHNLYLELVQASASRRRSSDDR